MKTISTPKLSKKDYTSFIIGMLLGDSSMTGTKNKRIVLTHSPKQKEYLEWKKNILETKTSCNVRYKTSKHSNGKTYPQICLETLTLPLYTRIYNLMYKDNKKNVSLDVLKKLTPIGLATWFMDDGSFTIHWYKRKDGTKSVKGIEYNLHTEGFSFEENNIIKHYFEQTWKISPKIHKTKKIYFKLYFNATEGKKLIEIIKPYIIPSMTYKICIEDKINLRKDT